MKNMQYPTYPHYETELFSDFKEMDKWLNKQNNSMRIVYQLFTEYGFVVTIVRERNSGDA